MENGSVHVVWEEEEVSPNSLCGTGHSPYAGKEKGMAEEGRKEEEEEGGGRLPLYLQTFSPIQANSFVLLLWVGYSFKTHPVSLYTFSSGMYNHLSHPTYADNISPACSLYQNLPASLPTSSLRHSLLPPLSPSPTHMPTLSPTIPSFISFDTTYLPSLVVDDKWHFDMRHLLLFAFRYFAMAFLCAANII